MVNGGFCSSLGLHRISLVCASGETVRRCVFDALESARKVCSPGAQFCWRTVVLDPAPPPRRAPRCDLPVVCPGFGFDRFIRTKTHRSTVRQPGTKSASHPADKPVINRLSSAGQPLILFFRRFTFPDMPCMKRVYRD